MEKKLIDMKEEEPVGEKKVYTPPTLNVYGKLTELTAAGTGLVTEGGDEKIGQPHQNPNKMA